MEISKHNYFEATTAITSISKALESLGGITPANINNDDQLSTEINNVVANLKKAQKVHQEFIEKAEKVKVQSDPKLISHAINRIGVINQRLKNNATEIARMTEAFKGRMKGASHNQVKFEEYHPLTVAPTQTDESRVAQDRENLLNELDQLNRFIEGNPFLDNSLLKNTDVEKHVQEVKEAA